MTEATLKSLAQTVDWEKHRMFVSDNGSCDETQALYESAMDWLPFVLIRNGRNIGTANAVNRAWSHREPGEHAVKMDNDVVIHQPEWVDWMEDVFKRDPSIGICGLKRRDLAECPWSDVDVYRSQLRMLKHEVGQRWIVVEEVKHVMGTCQAYSSKMLEKIGYLYQPSRYGFDDSLAATRAEKAGFKCVFLHGFEIDHVDPGGDDYCAWKVKHAQMQMQSFQLVNTQYKSGSRNVYYDGGDSLKNWLDEAKRR